MTRRNLILCAKALFPVAVAFVVLFIGPGLAKADIFEIESATGCPGSAGGGLCNGGTPFNLNSLLSAGISISSGTEKFVVTDTTGSFSILYTGSPGDNGSCQINGGTTSYFSTCLGTNSDGTTFSLGHDDTTHPGTNPPTTITFDAISGQCTSANPCSFDLGFVSMQGTGEVTGVPEGGSVTLYLVLDISAFLALGWLRHSRRASKFPNVTQKEPFRTGNSAKNVCLARLRVT
jgi:hypothetical protein